jgi:hypothetical protein
MYNKAVSTLSGIFEDKEDFFFVVEPAKKSENMRMTQMRLDFDLSSELCFYSSSNKLRL